MDLRALALAATSFCLALAAWGQIGRDGTVKDSGAPLRDPGSSLSDVSGPVYESVSPVHPEHGRLGGSPVSFGSRGVYGDGSVRDSSAGCVSDLRNHTIPLFGLAPPADHLNAVAAALSELNRIIQSLQPSASEAERTTEPSEETGLQTADANLPGDELGTSVSQQPPAVGQGAEQADAAAVSGALSADQRQLPLREEPAE